MRHQRGEQNTRSDFHLEELESRVLLSATSLLAVAGAPASHGGTGSMPDRGMIEAPLGNHFQAGDSLVTAEAAAADMDLFGGMETADMPGGGQHPKSANPPNVWTGSIPDGTVWASGAVEQISGVVTVPAGATLTIEPGAIVKFQAGAALVIGGTVQAQGVAIAPIIFTSVKDDSVGGDTNGDGGKTTPAAGDWNQIDLNNAGAVANFSFVQVNYGGGAFSSTGAMEVDSGQATFNNVQISNSRGAGLRLSPSTPVTYTLTNVSINGTAGDGVRVDSNASVNSTNLSVQNVGGYAVNASDAGKWTSTGSSLSGGGIEAIRFNGGTINGTQSWSDSVVYDLSSVVTVPEGAALTLPAGTIVKNESFSGLVVKGSLNVSGTASSPVIFTSLKDDTAGGDTNGDGPKSKPVPGDWGQIDVNDAAANGNFTFVEVRYGAGNFSGAGAIEVDSGQAAFADVKILNAVSVGLRLNSSLPAAYTLTNVSVLGTGSDAVRVDSNSTVIATNLIVQNAGGYAINADDAGKWSSTGTSISGTATPVIRFNGGNISDARTWGDSAVYDLSSVVTVLKGGSLTLPAGTVVKNESSGGLTIQGTLNAQGTAANPVIITSSKDDAAGGDTNGDGTKSSPAPGDWQLIEENDPAARSNFSFTELRYSGGFFSGAAGIEVDAGQATFNNVTVSNSKTGGIRLNSSAAVAYTLSNVTVLNAGTDGVRVDSNSMVTATNLVVQNVGGVAVTASDAGNWNSTGSSISGTGIQAIRFSGGQITDARSWNDSVVYYLDGEVTVAKGGSLTIPAGGIIKADRNGQLTVLGTLTAKGTASGPLSLGSTSGLSSPPPGQSGRIFFTSLQDDSVGGDTNGDGSRTMPAPGDFSRIWVNGGTADLEYLEVNYAGRALDGSVDSAVSISNGGPLVITHSLIQNSYGSGIWIFSGQATVTNNVISNVQGYGLRFDSSSAVMATGNQIINAAAGAMRLSPATPLTASGNTSTGSGHANVVDVTGGSVQASVQWQDPFTYHLMGNVTVNSGASLALGPGIIVKSDLGVQINVQGTFSAAGTAAAPDVFTSIKDDSVGGDTNSDGSATMPAPGDWDRVWANAPGAVVTLDNVKLLYGGKISGGQQDSSISVSQGATLTLTKSLVQFGAAQGVWIGSGTGTVTGDTISDVAQYGIRVDDTTYHQVLTNDKVANAASGAVYQTVDCDLDLTGSTWSNSGNANAIFVDVRGGSVTKPHTWGGDRTYLLSDNLVVGTSGNLTIGAGAILKFPKGTGVQVDGSLTANGSASDLVIITSARDDSAGGDTNGDGNTTAPAPGDIFSVWQRGGTVTMTDTKVCYAGLEPIGNNFAGTPSILTDGGHMFLNNVTIQQGFDVGLRARNSANVMVSNLTVRNVQADALSFQGSAKVSLVGGLLDQVGGAAATTTSGTNWSLSGVQVGTLGFDGMKIIGGGTIFSNWTLGQFGLVTVDPNSNLSVDSHASLTFLPGTIVKFGSNSRLDSDGVLTVDGGAQSPVIFTSINDSSVGGNSNGGVPKAPAAGDWRGIGINNSNSSFSNAIIQYAGQASSSPFAALDITAPGTSITPFQIFDVQISDSAADGIFVDRGSNVTIQNCLIDNFARYGVNAEPSGTIPVQLINNTIVGGQVGVYLTAHNANLVNNIFTGASVAGVQETDSAPAVAVRFSDVFNPGAAHGNYFDPNAGNWVPAGQIGDISADPLFTSPANRWFDLGPGSPAIDAASGNDASLLDLLGNSRRRDRSVPDTGTGLIPYVDIGAFEKQTSGTGVDLTVTSSTLQQVTSNGLQDVGVLQTGGGGLSLREAIILANQGTETLPSQPIALSVFLRPTSLGEAPRNLPDIPLLAPTQMLALGPNQTQTLTFNFTLPPLLDGAYQVGVTVDVNNQAKEAPTIWSRDNTFLPPNPFVVQNPTIAPGTPLVLPLVQSPTYFYAGSTVTAGQPVEFDFTNLVPTGLAFSLNGSDGQQIAAFGPGQPNSVQTMVPADSVFLLEPSGTFPANASVTLNMFALKSNLLTGVFPRTASNQGLVTFDFFGGPFSDKALPELFGPNGLTVKPLHIQATEAQNEVIAQFDLTQDPASNYTAVIDWGDGTQSQLGGQPIALTNQAVQPNSGLQLALDGPDVVRAGIPALYTLSWANKGPTDLTTPFLSVGLPDSAQWSLEANGKLFSGNVDLFGVTGNATNMLTLPTQTSGDFQFYVTFAADQSQIQLPVTSVPINDPSLNAPLNLDSILSAIKPPNADPTQWSGMEKNLGQSLGGTWSTALNTLAGNGNLDPSTPAGLPISPDRINQYIQHGAALFSHLLSDAMGAAYPSPANPAQGDGIHRDFVILVAMEDYSSSFVGFNYLNTGVPGVKVPVPVFNANLPGTQTDADNWTDFFSNDLNIPQDQIIVLRDRVGSTDDNVTFDKIQQAWQATVAQADANDKIKFIYTGHGSKNGGAMIMDTPYDAAGDQYVNAQKLRNMFAQNPMPGQTYMVFDSCYSAQLGMGLQNIPNLRWNSAVGTNETAPDQNSFSSALINAFRNQQNDLNGDGKVYISEATVAAKQQFTTATQHPQSGGDPSVDQELHDDIGNLTRNKTWTQQLGQVISNIGSSLLKLVTNVFAHDPNEKVGPVGFGAQHFVGTGDMPYSIFFENDPKLATAAAQVVTITDQLGPNLDWSTLTFGNVSFGNVTLSLAGSPSHASAQVYLPAADVSVGVTAQLDAATGIVKWVFTTLDPDTKLQTTDPLAGFLPPDVHSPEGEGHVDFTVRPKAGLPDGTVIQNQAVVVFDQNAPIATNTTSNTISNAPPQVLSVSMNGQNAQRSQVRTIAFTFQENTTLSFASDALQLVNTTTGASASTAGAVFSYDPSTKTGSVDLSHVSLPDGNYSATLRAAAVTDASGITLAHDYQFSFFVLKGDTNGDRVVNDLDLYNVWQNQLKPAAAANLNDDLNGDGKVDAVDLTIVQGNYLSKLATPGPANVALPTMPSSPKLLNSALAVLTPLQSLLSQSAAFGARFFGGSSSLEQPPAASDEMNADATMSSGMAEREAKQATAVFDGSGQLLDVPPLA
jgi:hypothetical protein